MRMRKMMLAVTTAMALMVSAASQIVGSTTSHFLDLSNADALTTALYPSASGLLEPTLPLTLAFPTTMFLSTTDSVLIASADVNAVNSMSTSGVNAFASLSTPLETASVGFVLNASAAMSDVSAITPATTVSDMMSSSSVSVSLSTTAATTAKPSATAKPPVSTTPDPARDVKCKGRLAPHASDATFKVLVTGALFYWCNPGFRQVSGKVFIRCGAAYGWVPRSKFNGRPDVVVCEAVEFEKHPPPSPVPGWLVPMVTVAVVLLTLLVFSALLLFVYVRSGAPFSNRAVHPWEPESPQPTAKDTEAKDTKGQRGWPWKRPWRAPCPARPPGHLGPDGVAWFISDDFAIFPVKR